MSRQEPRYARLGEMITDLTGSLAVAKRWSKKYTLDYVGNQTGYSTDMIYRWQQGRSCPSVETIEILIRIGKEEANLTREWGGSLLHAAHHPDTVVIMNRFWEPKEIRFIPCNLPARDRTVLIGRQVEIARLLELLSPHYAAHLITVDGIGGVGKTALVLEVAYRCWRASTGEEPNPKVPQFDAIIFVSAKQQYLTPDGLLPSNEVKRTLRDIYHEIASTLEHFEIMHAVPHEQFSLIRKVLGHQRTLLIVDNLETMQDKQEIISFLYELPPSVKVAITTREREYSFSPIRLDQLSKKEACDLIEKEAHVKEAEVSRKQAFNLYHYIGGIPAALVYVIGQIASGSSLETVLERIPKANSDVARFCFEGSLGLLRGQAAHRLLMAIAMFSKPPLRAAVAYTAGLRKDKMAVEEGLKQLIRLSLVREQMGRYAILPLTREYALTELGAHISFERQARKRWITWYRSFTREFGGKDWNDWLVRYDRIEEEWENLLTVFDWCAIHEQYEAIRAFWQERHIVNFANIYGYWDDRLFWLDWLIQAAEKRSDWSNAVRAMVDIGSTLTLINQFEDANFYFQRAWTLPTKIDSQVQLLLTQKIAELRIRQKDYTDASDWLDRAEVLLEEVITPLKEPERTRRLVDFESRKGLLFFHLKDYERAERCYQKMFDRAETIHWDRTAVYAQNHLAYIAIEQGRLDDAEELLEKSLRTNKDKRLAAFHKHIFAYFYQKKGTIVEARRLAKEAREDFERLGMRQETLEMEELLQQLER